MSQKNETKILALTLLLTVGIVGSGVWWFTNNSGVNILLSQETVSKTYLQDRISFGEKSFTPGDISPLKKEGVEAIAAKSYDRAIANFTFALKLNPNDPETLIFLNNARINSSKALIEALKRHPTRLGVQQALSSSDFSATGASGTIRFLASGDRNAPVQLVKIVPGSRSRTGYDFESVR